MTSRLPHGSPAYHPQVGLMNDVHDYLEMNGIEEHFIVGQDYQGIWAVQTTRESNDMRKAKLALKIGFSG
jgi:hypothetical protein